MNNLQIFVLMLAVVSLTALSALAQHKYYARTVRRLAAAHNRPDCMLVSGRGKTRFRGAIVILVLRKDDEQIQAAAVMEGLDAGPLRRAARVGRAVGARPAPAVLVAGGGRHRRCPDPGARPPLRPRPPPSLGPAPRGGRPVKTER